MLQVGQRRSLTDCFFGAIVLFYFTAICFLGRLCRSQRAGDYAGDDVVFVGFGDFGFVEAAGFQRLQRAEVVEVDFAVDLRAWNWCGLPRGAGFLRFRLRREPPVRGRATAACGASRWTAATSSGGACGTRWCAWDLDVERKGAGAFFVE